MALIDGGFPFLAVSRLAKLESYRKNIYRPPYYIHKWWARRVGTAFRGILLSSLLDDDADFLNAFYRRHDFSDRVVLDPFMGGGTTVGEALRLGCRVVGSDINPVAWFLVRKAVEDVHPNELDAAMTELEITTAPAIRDLYATRCKVCGGDSDAIYTYWVKVIRCGACGQDVQLRTSRVLARYAQDAAKGLVACPHCSDLNVVSGLGEKAECPGCSATFDPAEGSGRGGWYRCPACSHKGKILDVMRGQAGPPRHDMVGVHYACPQHGRMYKAADDHDLENFATIEARVANEWNRLLIPRSAIPSGYNTDQMIRYNYKRWADMFNSRQLLALSLLLEGIRRLDNRPVREYFALLASSLLEFNSMFAAAKGLGTGAVRHVFAHHAFIPQKEPLETNLWGAVRASGTFSTLYEERLKRGKRWCFDPVERRIDPEGKVVKVPIQGERLAGRLVDDWSAVHRGQDAFLLSGPSQRLPLPDRVVDVIVTDPPYFDNVMYSELADYFYVWLRLVLADDHPQFEPEQVERADEVIRNPNHGKEAEFYAEGLAEVFRECGRVLKNDGLLAFTFHHGRAEAWDAVSHALVASGFVVEAFYPIHSEMDVGVPLQGKNGIKFDILFVCRKATHSRGGQLESGYVQTLYRELATEFQVNSSEVSVLDEAAKTAEKTAVAALRARG